MKSMTVGAVFLAVFAAVEPAAGSYESKVPCGVAGAVVLSCEEPGPWSFQVAETTEGRVSEVTVRMRSGAPARPPKFALEFSMPGAGADHVWTPYDDRYTIWPKEWGKVRYSSQLAFRAPIAAAFGDGGRNVLSDRKSVV